MAVPQSLKGRNHMKATGTPNARVSQACKAMSGLAETVGKVSV
jgi:hypothetical protein